MKPYNVAIVGATGYTGSELIRILTPHPSVNIHALTSNSNAGQKVVDIHPQFKSLLDANTELISIDSLNYDELDLILLALPHGVSMDFVKNTDYSRCKIVDLSGDFRLDSPQIYEKWYGMKHQFIQGFNDAVYGMPELFRDEIKKARLIANPGCFPTGSILSLAPLVSKGAIKSDSIIVDAKTGITGAGAKPKLNTHFPNASENFSAYGLKKHRHTPEIMGTVSRFTGVEMSVTFTPHLLPVNRGILSTIYADGTGISSDEEINAIYTKFYKDEPFIRIVDTPPTLQQVRGTNYCDIFSTYDERTNKVICISVIDNLVKGAAGAAVQNMNLALGLDEREGLTLMPAMP
ncbi:MAG: N-acetyl-gamma-glutamyl-phosphate reductase [Balneolales bacterium]